MGWLPMAALGLVVALAGCGRGPGEAPSAQTPEPLRSAPAPHRDLLGQTPLYSHAKEEVVIRDLFQDRREGVFLDIGCGHPIHDSDTHHLEEHVGWSGIGVDALPELERKWRRRRPRSRFFSFIVMDRAGTVETFYRAEQRVRDNSAYEKPLRDPAGGPVQSEAIRVPTTTLSKLLDDAGVAEIDFLSIDIEGAELQALAGFDIRRFRPKLACIEAKPKNRVGIMKYFTEHGFERLERYLAHDPSNYYFASKARR